MAQSQLVFGRHPVAQFFLAPHSTPRGLYVQGSPQSCHAALRPLVQAAQAAGIDVRWSTKAQLDALSHHANHQGVILKVGAFAYQTLEAVLQKPRQRPGLVVVLDGIQDPHNLGALIRSAWAFSADCLIFAQDRACEVTGVAIKASAGAAAHLPIVRVVNLRRCLQTLKDEGFWVVGTMPDAAQELAEVDLSVPTVLIMGSEGDGMRLGTQKACDHLVRIPTLAQQSSLNAAVAGGICLYEVCRQRQL